MARETIKLDEPVLDVPSIPILAPNEKDARQMAAVNPRQEVYPGVTKPEGTKFIKWTKYIDRFTKLDYWVRMRDGVCSKCGEPVLALMKRRSDELMKQGVMRGAGVMYKKKFIARINSRFVKKLSPTELKYYTEEMERHLTEPNDHVAEQHRRQPEVGFDYEIPIGYMFDTELTKMNIQQVISGIDEIEEED